MSGAEESKMKQMVAISPDPFMKSPSQQLSPDFFVKSLAALDNKFKSRFEEPHRKLKASIHRCQANAYSKQGLSLEESEQMAR